MGGLFLAAATLLSAVPAFAAPGTMRVDYIHAGNAREERFNLDRIVIEPLPWPGNPARPFDDTNRGRYFFDVRDEQTGAALYSRGFASIYGEWETTAEALRAERSFSESLRFPAVTSRARISLKKRDAQNVFREVWSLSVDPADRSIERTASRPAGPLMRLHEAGDPSSKLDLLILGDGYTAAERTKFERDARRLLRVLFETSPFKEREGDINVWGLMPEASQSGVSYPSKNIARASPLGTTFDAFGSERYMLTFENRTLRDIAANAPYDAIEILANADTYGGGGIFNLYSITAVDNPSASYLFLHEFGHHLAGLADEYYTSDVAYLPTGNRVEPWEPNVTALLDPSTLKWGDLVTPGTPLPTPWPKEAFDALGALVARGAGDDAELGARSARQAALLRNGPHAGLVGAFEGANYEAHGYYRPQVDCLMFSRHAVPFCPVCRRAIDQILDLHARH